ncbi:MAG TPA: hypothetical protein VIL47_04910, partial [Candidatus Bipolaricaulota bacterium]
MFIAQKVYQIPCDIAVLSSHYPKGLGWGKMMNALYSFCQKNQDSWLTLLEQLVNTDSGSYDPAGLEAMIQLMKSQWDALGFATELVTCERGPHLVAKRLSKDAKVPTLLLLGHLDTVFDPG